MTKKKIIVQPLQWHGFKDGHFGWLTGLVLTGMSQVLNGTGTDIHGPLQTNLNDFEQITENYNAAYSN